MVDSSASGFTMSLGENASQLRVNTVIPAISTILVVPFAIDENAYKHSNTYS